MKKYKTVTTKMEVVEDIICNKCGESLRVDEYNFCGLEDAKVIGCYGSKHIGDLVEYEFHLCEKCVMELIESFKIPADCNMDHYEV